MAHKLADETLATILADCLAVDDADFACVSMRTSPFALKEVSSSALLVVCKRWMRIGTPLLYETVILRSVAQSRALAAALKANEAFGLYIKKLRVEGGYGASVPVVLKAATRITDLCVSLDLEAGDNAKPMYNILFEAIAPTRLIVTGVDANKRNAQLVHALSTVVHCIKSWPQLRVVVVGDRLLLYTDILREAVCAAPKLDSIHILDGPWRGNWLVYCSRFARRCAASVVHLDWVEHPGVMDADIRPKDVSRKGLAKIRFRDEKLTGFELCAERVEKSPDPFFRPLGSASASTRREIWTTILREVVTKTAGIAHWKRQGADRNLPRKSALQCMLVCKEWKEIVLPIACEDLQLSTEASWVSLNKTLKSSRQDIPQFTRKLTLDHRTRSYDKCSFDNTLPTFLAPFNALQSLEVRQITFTPAAFATLGNTVPSLSRLVISLCKSALYKLPIFPVLRVLDWNTANDTDFEAMHPESAESLCPMLESLKIGGKGTLRLFRALIRNGLPRLTDANVAHGSLSASHFDASKEVLDPITLPLLKTLAVGGKGMLHSLIPLNLPELRTLKLDKCDSKGVHDFAGAHGHLLTSVYIAGADHHINFFLDSCPNVSKIEFDDAYPEHMTFKPLQPLNRAHTALAEIVCPARSSWTEPTTAQYAKFAEPVIAEWTRFLDSLPLDQLPHLRTIRVRERAIWPTTAKEMKKHPLPAIAEGLAERGVRLVDAKGVGWKPRITTKRK
ncbi:hypothetical protein EXIGLDRAFT_764589 [Exidia glandulosa HHB12029]|uniref:Uncharacterized protein n=1 Tax=Exidia glandulosa HHB12029 TaxID=1314781 RepID=A0A166B2D0_EXIGL|nr:hypothetical protein EXIGLDRAFT_764589 [Exidia glandulosa HHB12029]